MSLRSYPNRVLSIAAAASAGVLVILGSIASTLQPQQAEAAAFLTENIRSLKAADILEESLTELILHHERGVADVSLLRYRVRQHLNDIEQLSDKPREQELTARLKQRFEAYE